MSKPQYIKTPEGTELAVLPREEFERLVEAAEDAEDRRALDEINRKLATGESELIPAAYVDRIIDGENKVRVWREFRGLKTKELAEAASIKPNYLSLIEAGKRAPSIKVMKALAGALRVDIDDIV